MVLGLPMCKWQENIMLTSKHTFAQNWKDGNAWKAMRGQEAILVRGEKEKIHQTASKVQINSVKKL